MAIYYLGENPCKNCEERRQKCHSVCEKYKTWKSTAVEKRFVFWKTPAHERHAKRDRIRSRKD